MLGSFMIHQFMILIQQCGYSTRHQKLSYAIAGKINHEHEDFATITLGFKDNKTATISSNWITPIRVRNFNARLY